MREYTPGNPLVFTDVPKSVGTSLREAVRASLEPEIEFTGFGRAELGCFTDICSLHPAIRRQVVMDPGELPANAQFISGHIEPSTTRARFPDADHFTILREPRVRALSTWLFARSHSDFNLRGWGSFAAWIRAARSNLLEYMTNSLVASHIDNGMARLLLWPHDLTPCDGFIDPAHDDELVEEAIAMLDSFAYVGVVEAPGWVDGVGDWLGRRLTLPRLQEVNTLPQPGFLDLNAELSDGADEQLNWRTRIDTRIWRHLAARFLPSDSLDEVSERAYRSAVKRYSALVRNPFKLPFPRRVLEHSYALYVRMREAGGGPRLSRTF
jgi:hypothetical protein